MATVTLRRADRPSVAAEAAVIFAQGGYADTHMNHIAAVTGLSKPKIYSLFTSKASLYTAAVAYEVRMLTDAVIVPLTRLQCTDARQVCARVLARMWLFQKKRPHALRLLFGGTDWRNADAVRLAARDDLLQAISGALAAVPNNSADGVAGPSPAALFTFALGTIEQLYAGRLSRAEVRAAAAQAGALLFRRPPRRPNAMPRAGCH